MSAGSRSLRGLAAIPLCAALAFAFPARAGGERIAVFTKNLTNDNYVAIRLGAGQAARRLGARVQLMTPAVPDSAPQQIALLRAAMKSRPDAIVISVADDVLLEPEIRRVAAAKTPVIAIVNRARPRDVPVTFVGADDEAAGFVIAGRLFRELGGRGDIVVMEGPPSAPASRLRVAGIHRALKDYPDIRLLGSADGEFQRQPSYVAMKALLARFPRIDGVVAANDLGALGALHAMEEARRPARVVGVNGIIEAAQAVGDGRLLATLELNGFNIGCLSLEAAVRRLRGQPVPREILLPTPMIDRANYQAWLTPLAQRTCPSWESQVR